MGLDNYKYDEEAITFNVFTMLSHVSLWVVFAVNQNHCSLPSSEKVARQNLLQIVG